MIAPPNLQPGTSPWILPPAPGSESIFQGGLRFNRRGNHGTTYASPEAFAAAHPFAPSGMFPSGANFGAAPVNNSQPDPLHPYGPGFNSNGEPIGSTGGVIPEQASDTAARLGWQRPQNGPSPMYDPASRTLAQRPPAASGGQPQGLYAAGGMGAPAPAPGAVVRGLYANASFERNANRPNGARPGPYANSSGQSGFANIPGLPDQTTALPNADAGLATIETAFGPGAGAPAAPSGRGEGRGSALDTAAGNIGPAGGLYDTAASIENADQGVKVAENMAQIGDWAFSPDDTVEQRKLKVAYAQRQLSRVAGAPDVINPGERAIQSTDTSGKPVLTQNPASINPQPVYADRAKELAAKGADIVQAGQTPHVQQIGTNPDGSPINAVISPPHMGSPQVLDPNKGQAEIEKLMKARDAATKKGNTADAARLQDAINNIHSSRESAPKAPNTILKYDDPELYDAMRKEYLDYIQSRSGGKAAKPANQERKLTGVDQQAADWAAANPNDPRAAKIRQRLGL